MKLAMFDSDDSEPSIFTEEWARLYVQRKFWGFVSAVAIAALCCVIWSARAAWRFAGRQGWVAQTKAIAVDVDGDWMVGEYRDCTSNGSGGFLNCPDPGKVGYDPLTNPIPERVLSVAFWGDISRVSPKSSLWQCKRERDSISCRPHT
jgi:hypothetical protein